MIHDAEGEEKAKGPRKSRKWASEDLPHYFEKKNGRRPSSHALVKTNRGKTASKRINKSPHALERGKSTTKRKGKARPESGLGGRPGKSEHAEASARKIYDASKKPRRESGRWQRPG